MIVTVTPNPSLDRSAEVSRIERGTVLRTGRLHLEPGGKGVNVARALAAANHSTVALLPSGGPEGARLASLLAPEGVSVAPVPIKDSTRSNLTLVEPDGTTTKVNEPGPCLTEDEGAMLERRIRELADRADWIVGCGSLPDGLDDDFYARLVAAGRAAGARVALDASGSALAAGCAAKPDLIKPNLAELAELAERPLLSLGDALSAADELHRLGVGAVLASLGKHGALLVDDTGTRHATTTSVPVRSTVGAGDAALAGFLGTTVTGEMALRAAAAYGAAAVALPGTRMPGPPDVTFENVNVTTSMDPSTSLSGVLV